jgi:hypothetical protein
MDHQLLNAVIGRLEGEYGRAQLGQDGYRWRIPVADRRGRSVEVTARAVAGCQWVDLTVLDSPGEPHAPTVSITVRDEASADDVVAIVRRCAGRMAGAEERGRGMV